MSKSLNIELKQGAPVVEGVYEVARGEDVIAIEIAMESKYCTLFASFSDTKRPPKFIIGATDGALYLHPEFDKMKYTEIILPDLPGWTLFSQQSGRYAINICMVKH